MKAILTILLIIFLLVTSTNLDNTFTDNIEANIEYLDNEPKSEDSNDDTFSDTTAQNKNEEADKTQLQDVEGEDIEEESGEEEEKAEDEEEEIEDGAMKFFLDGDIESGIYLGKTTASLESEGSWQNNSKS